MAALLIVLIILSRPAILPAGLLKAPNSYRLCGTTRKDEIHDPMTCREGEGGGEGERRWWWGGGEGGGGWR